MAMSKRMRKAIPIIGEKYPLFQTDASIEEMIRFVLKTWRDTRPRNNLGQYDDQRDIMNWSEDLAPLSEAELHLIIGLRPRKVKEMIRDGDFPFGKLLRTDWEYIKTLPGRVLLKMAHHRLDVLESRRSRKQ